MMAMMMEVATRESELQEGRRIGLPLTGELESEQKIRADLQQKHEVDPLDVEAMLAVAVPRP